MSTRGMLLIAAIVVTGLAGSGVHAHEVTVNYPAKYPSID